MASGHGYGRIMVMIRNDGSLMYSVFLERGEHVASIVSTRLPGLFIAILWHYIASRLSYSCYDM